MTGTKIFLTKMSVVQMTGDERMFEARMYGARMIFGEKASKSDALIISRFIY
jgi:hypothetical protein